MNKFLIIVAACFFLYKLVHLIIRTMKKKNQNEKHYRKQEFDEKNIHLIMASMKYCQILKKMKQRKKEVVKSSYQMTAEMTGQIKKGGE